MAKFVRHLKVAAAAGAAVVISLTVAFVVDHFRELEFATIAGAAVFLFAILYATLKDFF
jgi:hypothetical protein